jgi:hypothetical protein
LALRAEAEALEAKVKSSVSTLAALRKELLEVPTSPYPDNSRPVPARDLLRYAMKISQYTVPPTYREPIPEDPQGKEKEKEKEDDATSAAPTNGFNTPALSQPVVPNEAPAESEEEKKDEGAPAAAEWLQKLRAQGITWQPYPDAMKIRVGNLGQVQYLIDQGKDPWTEKVTTQDEQELMAQKQREAEEQQEQARAELEAQARAQVEAQAPPGQAHPSQEHREPQEVSQFKGFEFEEEEDD